MFNPSKPRCKGCTGKKHNFAVPGREWCWMHDPDLAAARVMASKTRRPPAERAAAAVEKAATQSQARAVAAYSARIDQVLSPHLERIREALLAVHDDLGEMVLDVDGRSTPGLAADVARAKVAALKACADILQKERDQAIKEREQGLKYPKPADAPGEGPPLRSLEDELSDSGGDSAPRH